MAQFQPSPLSIEEHAVLAARVAVARMKHEREMEIFEGFRCLAMPGFVRLSPIKKWFLLKLEQDGVRL